jgi:hypothetical protein
MRIPRMIVIVLVIAIIAIVGLYAYTNLFAPETSSSAWDSAPGYPLQVGGTSGVAGQQCVSNAAYVYCIGGQDANGGPRSEVYSSSAISSSSANITSWTSDSNQYPRSINGQACVVYSGYAYCVGGSYDDGGDDVASSYFAPLSSGGVVGSWNSTTAYPIPIDSQYCVASSGYVYCVGGNNETDGTNADSVASNSVWYAQLSASGIGPWSPSTAYPENLYFSSCFADNGYIYCLGGADSSNNAQSADYYASLSPAGVGTWTRTTAYPLQGSGLACAISSGFIYCVGGQGELNSYTNAVYYAPISSGGIGTWKQAANYPLSVETTCVISLGDLYCIGGFDGSSVGENNAVYYISLASLSGATTSGQG